MNNRIVDIGGVYGSMLHYSLTIAFVGSAFLLFFYFWRKNRLDMDEEPKIAMLNEPDQECVHGDREEENEC